MNLAFYLSPAEFGGSPAEFGYFSSLNVSCDPSLNVSLLVTYWFKFCLLECIVSVPLVLSPVDCLKIPRPALAICLYFFAI